MNPTLDVRPFASHRRYFDRRQVDIEASTDPIEEVHVVDLYVVSVWRSRNSPHSRTRPTQSVAPLRSDRRPSPNTFSIAACGLCDNILPRRTASVRCFLRLGRWLAGLKLLLPQPTNPPRPFSLRSLQPSAHLPPCVRSPDASPLRRPTLAPLSHPPTCPRLTLALQLAASTSARPHAGPVVSTVARPCRRRRRLAAGHGRGAS